MNLKPILCLVLVAGVAGCGGGASSTSAPGEGSEGDSTESTGGETTQAEVAPDPPPTPETLRALMQGDHSVIRPEHGVRIAEYGSDPGGESPFANADGVIERAELLCGEALDEWLASLPGEWDYRLDDEYMAPSCDGDVCRFEFMGEYDRAPEVTFIRVGGALVLHSVVAIEGGAVGEEFIAAGERFTANAIAEMADARCQP